MDYYSFIGSDMKRFIFLLIVFLFLFNDCYSQEDTIKYKLKPVTITATRIAEPWIGVPLALSVINVNGTLAGKGYGIDEILSSIPGVLAQSRYGNQDVRISIRGFGARGAGAKSNAGTSRGIRILLDGFPETEPDGRTSMDLIDISGAGSVEVVRSNASAVWGNASGGVVNVISNSGFDEPYADVQSSFGSYGFHKEMVQAGTMLDAGRFFLSLSNTNSKGWRYHSSSTQTLINTGIVSPLGDRTSLGVYLTGSGNLFRIPGPLSQAQYDSLAEQADSTFIKRDERRFNRLGRIGVTLSHDINHANSISTSAFIGTKYLQRSERGTFRDFNRYHVGGNATYRNNISFSDEVKNILLVGADEAYQDGALHFYTLTASGDRSTTVKANKREGANNFGVFIQNEISIGNKFSVIAGARYDNITYYYNDYISPQLDDSKSFEHITPKAGITYRLSATQSIYANFGGGVEAPAGNEVDPVPTFGTDTVRALNSLLEPITSVTVELGTKHIVLLGGEERIGSLIYDAALYWLEVRNDIIPYDDGGYYFTAGRTQRMGAEVSVNLQLNNGLSFETAMTFSNNKYKEYLIDSVHLDQSRAGHYADLKDNKMSGVPEFFYSIGLRYSPKVLKSAYAKITALGVGDYFADDRNLYKTPAYNIINVSVGVDNFKIPDSKLFVRGFFGINNLTDQKYASSVWINPQLNSMGKPVYLEPGLPRNFIGSVSLGIYL